LRIVRSALYSTRYSVSMTRSPPPAPTRTPPYRSAAGMALAVVVLLALNIPAAIAVVWADMSQLEMIDAARSKNGDRLPSQRELRAVQERTASAGLAWSAVYALTAAAWLLWFHRMYANLPALGTEQPRSTPGWAVAVWFVPILNLFRPHDFAQEIWSEAAPASGQRRSGLILAWWACWIGLKVAGLVAAGMDAAALTSISLAIHGDGPGKLLQAFRDSTRFVAFTDALEIPMAILALFVVRAMTRRQAERAEAVISGVRFRPGASGGATAP